MSSLLNSKHFHHLIAEVVDDFHGDTAGFGFVEGSGGVAVQRGPGFFVDLGSERGFEGAVRVVRAEEVGVADEEAFFVVVGVDEPAGDAFGTVAADFAGLGCEYVHAMNRDLCLVVSDQ